MLQHTCKHILTFCMQIRIFAVQYWLFAGHTVMVIKFIVIFVCVVKLPLICQQHIDDVFMYLCALAGVVIHTVYFRHERCDACIGLLWINYNTKVLVQYHKVILSGSTGCPYGPAEETESNSAKYLHTKVHRQKRSNVSAHKKPTDKNMNYMYIHVYVHIPWMKLSNFFPQS